MGSPLETPTVGCTFGLVCIGLSCVSIFILLNFHKAATENCENHFQSPKQTNYVNGLLTASYKYLYFDPKQSSTSGKESASGKRKQTSKVALAVWLWMRRAAGEAALSTLEAAGPHLYIVMAAVTRCSADCWYLWVNKSPHAADLSGSLSPELRGALGLCVTTLCWGIVVQHLHHHYSLTMMWWCDRMFCFNEVTSFSALVKWYTRVLCFPLGLKAAWNQSLALSWDWTLHTAACMNAVLQNIPQCINNGNKWLCGYQGYCCNVKQHHSTSLASSLLVS